MLTALNTHSLLLAQATAEKLRLERELQGATRTHADKVLACEEMEGRILKIKAEAKAQEQGGRASMDAAEEKLSSWPSSQYKTDAPDVVSRYAQAILSVGSRSALMAGRVLKSRKADADLDGLQGVRIASMMIAACAANTSPTSARRT